jgi:hypothetical protein
MDKLLRDHYRAFTSQELSPQVLAVLKKLRDETEAERKVVRTPAGETEFIVGYSQWWGWFGRPVAVPLEALGIEGGHLVSLDMSPSEFAAAPTWRDTDAPPLPNDAIVRVALSRS